MNAKNILSEMEQEFVSTKNLLGIVPEEKLDFKPHPKSMPLGNLALHIATIPSNNLQFAKDGKVETIVIVNHPTPKNKKEILDALDASIDFFRTLLKKEDDTWLQENWNLLKQNTSIAEMPTTVFLRTFVLNHWYHHRGQLSVYLRMLNLELPSIYGPTADNNPFA